MKSKFDHNVYEITESFQIGARGNSLPDLNKPKSFVFYFSCIVFSQTPGMYKDSHCYVFNQIADCIADQYSFHITSVLKRTKRNKHISTLTILKQQNISQKRTFKENNHSRRQYCFLHTLYYSEQHLGNSKHSGILNLRINCQWLFFNLLIPCQKTFLYTLNTKQIEPVIKFFNDL